MKGHHGPQCNARHPERKGGKYKHCGDGEVVNEDAGKHACSRGSSVVTPSQPGRHADRQQRRPSYSGHHQDVRSGAPESEQDFEWHSRREKQQETRADFEGGREGQEHSWLHREGLHQANSRTSGSLSVSWIMPSNCMPSFVSTRIEPSLSGDVIATMRPSPSTSFP